MNERLCKLCASVDKTFIEDEYHVLMECEFYNELRNIYLDIRPLPINLFSFTSIVSTQDNDDLTRLGCFLASMFKVRQILLSAL